MPFKTASILRLYLLKGRDVEVEVLSVDGVLLILLLGRLHLSEVLVEEGIVLLKLELHIGIRIANVIIVGEVGDLIEVNG